VFRGKKQLFVMQNLGIWGGDNGDTGSKYVVESGSAIFGIAASPTLICLFTMKLLWGYNSPGSVLRFAVVDKTQHRNFV